MARRPVGWRRRGRVGQRPQRSVVGDVEAGRLLSPCGSAPRLGGGLDLTSSASPRPRNLRPKRAAIAAAGWAVAFGALHVYWASGGRGGLGATAADADEAFSTTWFWAYNAVVAMLSLGGAVVAASTVVATSPRTARLLRAASWAAAGVLVARGAVGILLLVLDLAAGGLDPRPPVVLLLIEPAFIVGGLAFAAVARGEGAHRQRRGPA